MSNYQVALNIKITPDDIHVLIAILS